MIQDEEDKRLIEEIQSNEQHKINAAVGELLEKARPLIAQVVRAGGGGEEDIKVISNEAGLDIYLLIKKGSFDEDRSNWRTVIYAIAKNKWFDRKKNSIKEQIRFSPIAFTFLPPVSAFGNPVEEEIFMQEDKEKIISSLQQLGHTCRELMRKIYFEGASLRAISETTQVSESNIKQRHKRCKEKLKHIFGTDPRFE